MKKYYANMSVNNGTHYRPDWQSTNWRKLAREISNSARGNCFLGNEFSWKVWDEENICIAAGAGRKTKKGYCYYDCSHLIGHEL